MREIIVKAEEKLSETDKGQVVAGQTPVLATPAVAVAAFVGGYTFAQANG
ncbi:hypothetical protein ACFPA8_06900 [Streptomyces ovatisporus]|uniref:Class IIb bacteriocin, lactobin A/cerein 7B family n=1 Tax=Streptomyces ovatisporus TaxID=1128682 RepID=A0ABV9A453_9ACTN